MLAHTLVEAMFQNYTVVRQYPVLDYHVEFYIPELNIAVEFEGDQHSTEADKSASALREAEIKRKIGCKFIRVPH